jgi:K+-sensing histidine kinase KdpD
MKEMQPKAIVDARDRFQKRADGESEPQRRAARAFDRLSAALVAEGGLDRLLTNLLDVFVELTRAQAAVIRLRDGESLRARAAIGLEEEIAAGFSTSLHDSAPDGAAPAAVFELEPRSTWRSKAMFDEALRTILCAPLQDRGSLLGVVCLGFATALPPNETDKGLLALIAERAAAGIARQRAFEALENGVMARDEVLAVVAHDLRNPLNVITLAANSMLQRSTDTAARRPLERILRGARRADRLIADLLEVTAIEGGRLTLDRRPTRRAARTTSSSRSIRRSCARRWRSSST